MYIRVNKYITKKSYLELKFQIALFSCIYKCRLMLSKLPPMFFLWDIFFVDFTK